MGEAEVLEVGTGRHRERSRGVRLALLTAGLALAVVVVLADGELRSREERSVEGCAADVATAVDVAGRRVQTTYEYVRPALSNASDPLLREGLLGLVSEVAEGAEDRLAAAVGACADLTIVPTHGELRDRRDDCLDVLEAQGFTLRALARDGSTIQAWLDAPRDC